MKNKDLQGCSSSHLPSLHSRTSTSVPCVAADSVTVVQADHKRPDGDGIDSKQRGVMTPHPRTFFINSSSLILQADLTYIVIYDLMLHAL